MLLAARPRGWRLTALLLLAALCTCQAAGDNSTVSPVTHEAAASIKPNATVTAPVPPNSTVHTSKAPVTTNTTAHTTPLSTTAKATTKGSTPATTNTTVTTPAAKPTQKSTTVSSTTSSAVTSSISSAIQKPSGFDLGSFIGGIVLTLGILAVAYFGCRFYNSRSGVRYRTIDEHEAII